MSDQQTRKDLQTVSRLKIFFGHQSVGQNVVDALRDLAVQCDVPDLRFVSAHSLPGAGAGYFADARIGENHEPDLKCAAFSAQVQAILRQNPPEIAFMKFCYSDIGRDTDVQAVFNRYRATIDSLKAAAPHVRFAHMTVPLTVGTSTLRKMAFRLLGREGTADIGNVKREEFNALLRNYYRNEPVFDIAQAQSTGPGGEPETSTVEGKACRRMYTGYASEDGAHLNPDGARVVARQLCRFLALLTAPVRETPAQGPL